MSATPINDSKIASKFNSMKKADLVDVIVKMQTEICDLRAKEANEIKNLKEVIGNREDALRGTIYKNTNLQADLVIQTNLVNSLVEENKGFQQEIANLKTKLTACTDQEVGLDVPVKNNAWMAIERRLTIEQVQWLWNQGCTASCSSNGYKLVLKKEAVKISQKIANALVGKVQRDYNSTWIYFQ